MYLPLFTEYCNFQFFLLMSVLLLFSSQSADTVRKDATLSSTQRNFILNLASCLVSMLRLLSNIDTVTTEASLCKLAAPAFPMVKSLMIL